MKCALSVVAGLAVACPVLGQTTLYLTRTVDISAACNVNDPSTYVGSNPSAIALIGNRLFVAGFNNAGNAIPKQVVYFDNVLQSPTGPTAVDGAAVAIPNFRGYTGFAFRNGSGLVAAYDNGNLAAGQIRLINDALGVPSLGVQSPGLMRGGAGPAWDSGFDGNGYEANYNGAGSPALAAVTAHVDFGQAAGIRVGPLGLNPATLNADVGESVYVYQDPAGHNLRLDFAGISGTFWRDLDVHPTNGTMVARANNDLVIGTRPSNNGNFAQQILVDGGDAPFVVGQNVSILWGAPGGDAIIYTDRTDSASTSQSFLNAVKMVNMDGTPRTVSFKNLDGSDAVFPLGNAYYDLFWDGANGVLAVCDFFNRNVYVFSHTPPEPECPADFNGDEFVDFFDLDAFIECFEGGACPDGKTADFNGDEFIDFFDLDAFVEAFETGC
ncbi:MAG: hypothetical protein HRU70_00095 [Phycisphaeraceae bacterium]|nr:MAG: hypothetical protein HRU70_00095 [Phycisphaeraceae bacterium]